MPLSNCFVLLVLLWLSKSCVFAGVVPQPVVAKTQQAEYIGFHNETYNFDTWLGVRYAEPPIGVRRLQPPQHINGKGRIDAIKFGPRCFSVSAGPDYAGIDEDCLFLSIFKPVVHAVENSVTTREPQRPMPVLLFLHGGGFNDGTGQLYRAEALANQSAALREPIIVITINYRLSFLGWSGKCIPFPPFPASDKRTKAVEKRQP
jgi:carboxylesterase type B